MTVSVRIQSYSRSLTEAEQAIAAFILKHHEEIPLLTVHEIAERAAVSAASVSRLTKKLGYRNLRELKIDLAQETAPPLEKVFETITQKHTDKEILGSVFSGYTQSLQDTLAVLDPNSVSRTADLIVKKERVVYFGIGGSGNVAREASLILAHIGIRTEAYTDAYEMYIRALQLGKKDMVFGISHSGRSDVTVKAVALAHQSGAATVGISNYPESPLASKCDILLRTAFAEKRVSASGLSSRIAQLSLLDSLYLLVARRLKTLGKVNKIESMAESLLRSDEKHP